MFDAQTIGAAALVAIAAMGMVIPEIPHELVVIAAATVGSIQAASARFRNGSLKGWGHMAWAFIAGFTAGYLIGRAVADIMGLTSDMSELLPVYIFSLMGGRLVLYFITGFNIEALGDWIVSVITRKKQ